MTKTQRLKNARTSLESAVGAYTAKKKAFNKDLNLTATRAAGQVEQKDAAF